MKKKVISLILTLAMCFTLAAPAFACTPRYVPVSQQSWYVSMQSALDSITVTVPKVNITVPKINIKIE